MTVYSSWRLCSTSIYYPHQNHDVAPVFSAECRTGLLNWMLIWPYLNPTNISQSFHFLFAQSILEHLRGAVSAVSGSKSAWLRYINFCTKQRALTLTAVLLRAVILLQVGWANLDLLAITSTDSDFNVPKYELWLVPVWMLPLRRYWTSVINLHDGKSWAWKSRCVRRSYVRSHCIHHPVTSHHIGAPRASICESRRRTNLSALLSPQSLSRGNQAIQPLSIVCPFLEQQGRHHFTVNTHTHTLLVLHC